MGRDAGGHPLGVRDWLPCPGGGSPFRRVGGHGYRHLHEEAQAIPVDDGMGDERRQPWLTFAQDTEGVKERPVLFEGRLDADFAVISLGLTWMLVWLSRARIRFPGLLRLPLIQPLLRASTRFQDIANRGIRVLLD